jgi:hypothetical protein
MEVLVMFGFGRDKGQQNPSMPADVYYAIEAWHTSVKESDDLSVFFSHRAYQTLGCYGLDGLADRLQRLRQRLVAAKDDLPGGKVLVDFEAAMAGVRPGTPLTLYAMAQCGEAAGVW